MRRLARKMHTQSIAIGRAGIISVTTLALASGAGMAQANYTPDFTVFDGSNGYEFPPSEAFDLSDGATIEFWVRCDWEEDPGYDPVMLSNIGEEGALYVVAISGDRSALSLQSGDNLESVPFDCSGEEMQFVAIADFSDFSAVMINGRVAGTFDYGFSKLSSRGLWVGSADGTQAGFIGVVAGLRFWDVALDRGDLVDFSVRDIFQSDQEHPDADALLAQSDFANDTIRIFSGVAEVEDFQTYTGDLK